MRSAHIYLAATLSLLVLACGGPDDPSIDASASQPDAFTPALCAAHSDCNNERFCDGLELCVPGDAMADARGCVPGELPCGPTQTCDEASARCLSDCTTNPDADGDNDRSTNCGGYDCDDNDPEVHSGAVEHCDAEGRDEDCDPTTLAGPAQTDLDGDGYVSSMCCNIQDTGALRCGLDCDDNNRAVHPAHPEICDGLDNDCDGTIDEGVRRTFYRDADGDLYGDPSDSVEACVQPPGYVANADDCDDSSNTIYPGAPETCNTIDDDCDGSTDEAVTPVPATAEHCGGCNLACPTGFTCDGTMCVDIPVKLAAGATSTCALTAAGNVWCWGGNEEGEIGIGSTDLVVDRPANVALPMPAVDISIVSGYVLNGLSTTYIANVCAVLMNGSSECWGTEYGSTPTASSFPSPTGGMVAFTGHLARNSAGAVYRLNHDYTWSRTNLGPATALTTWCARRADGNLHCLSSSNAESEYPAVAGGAVQNSGSFHSHCATRSDGRLLCWGSNAANQIGPGPANIPAPVLVTELPTLPVVSVSVHSAFVSRGAGAPGYQHGHTCAALVDGRTYCWGRNSRGEVGNGTTSTDAVTSPALVSTDARFVHVAAGFSHTCAISDVHELWCWGANNGILGTADTSDALVPARLFGFPVTVAPTPTP